MQNLTEIHIRRHIMKINDIKNTIFEKYEIRKSRKQKTAFIEYIQGVCAENGIPVTIEKSGRNRNIVMGASPENCETVLGAHYDTCAVMPFPNFLTPKNFLVYLIYQLIICAVMFLPGVALAVVLYLLGYGEFSPMAFCVLMFVMLFLLMFGPANKHTANDNTSGVITVLNTMLSMTAEQREKVCFVLFDNEELGLLGSSAFATMHKKTMKNKPLINFDCVSDGDYLFVKLPKKEKNSEFGTGLTSALEKAAGKTGMKTEFGTGGMYPSDQANFKRGVAVAAFNRSGLVGLYLDKIHTKKDTVFNERNIECITEGVLEYLACGENVSAE